VSGHLFVLFPLFGSPDASFPSPCPSLISFQWVNLLLIIVGCGGLPQCELCLVRNSVGISRPSAQLCPFSFNRLCGPLPLVPPQILLLYFHAYLYSDNYSVELDLAINGVPKTIELGLWDTAPLRLLHFPPASTLLIGSDCRDILYYIIYYILPLRPRFAEEEKSRLLVFSEFPASFRSCHLYFPSLPLLSLSFFSSILYLRRCRYYANASDCESRLVRRSTTA